MALAQSFAALASLRRWMLWKLDGGVKKPVSPLTGWVHDPMDVHHHVTFAEAEQAAKAFGVKGVAFVFTGEDSFFFLDIDKCRIGNTWSPLAHELLSLFGGAGVEVSQSGNGLHVVGAYSGPRPIHGCKSKIAPGIELYTAGRFMAFTGTNAQGDVRRDCTEALAYVVAKYFPVTGDAGTPGEADWKDEADPSWRGPADDAELLAAMFAARPTAGQILGGKATPLQLWTADVQALGNAFPDRYKTPPRPWDYSDADAALLQHLAFWTGRNTERMRRLMMQSGLRRAKWEEHKSYLWRSVVKACGNQRDVYKAKAAQVSPAPAEAVTAPPGALPGMPASDATQLLFDVDTPTLVTGAQWLTTTAQVDFFKGCVYVRDAHRAFMPDGSLIKPEAFRAMLGGFVFSLDTINDKTTRNAWECFTESQAVRFPRVETTCFRPELKPGAIVREEGQRLLNTYVPVDTPRKPGDVSLFLTHLRKLFPERHDYEIVLAYMAALVQHPGKKFQWWPLIQGCEGNGKTVLGRVIAACVGHKYTHLPNARALGDQGSTFTAWLDRKLFICIEEISFRDRADIFDALKPLITNDRIEIQAKGVDQKTGDNRANGMAFCNGKEDIAVGLDKRRYAVFYTPQQYASDLERDGMGQDYFIRLYGWLDREGYAIVNDFLRTYSIPDELNPATTLMRAPATTSTDEMVELSLGPIEQEILEAIHEARYGFAGGWVSSLALERLFMASAKGRNIPPRRRRAIMQTLGFEWHPGLPEGRVHNMIPAENGKPRLYIRQGHIAEGMRDPSKIVEHYLQAQGTAPILLPAGASPINRIGA